MDKQGILIIDINTEMIQKISEALEPEGYSLFSADSGEAGIALAKKEIPSLIFVNAGISEGMRGLEICKTIHEAENLAHIPVIILTPRNVIITGRDRELYGIVDYVTYIFNTEDLRRKIRDLVSPAQTGKPQSAQTPEKVQGGVQDTGIAGDDRMENPEPEAQSDIAEPESTDAGSHEQTPDRITEETPGLAIPPLSTEEYEHTYRQKKFRKSVLFVSLVIILTGIGAGGIIFYEDISSISFFHKSQPELILPSLPGEQHNARIAPLDDTPKPQQESTASPPENTASSQVIEKKDAASAKDTQSVRATGAAKPAPSPVKKSEVKPVEKVVYAVQIGVFTQEKNATSLVRQYQDKGYSTWLYQGFTSKGAPLYRVLIGQFELEKDARNHADAIRARENIPVVLFKK